MNGQISARLFKNRFGGQIGRVMNFKMDQNTLELADITFDGNMSTESEDNELGNIMKNLPNIEADLSSSSDIDSI